LWLLVAEVAIVFVLVIYGGGRCCYLLINTVLLLCLLNTRMLPTKRELGKRGGRAGSSRTDKTAAETHPQVDTGASSLSDDRGSSPVEATNEPARESGSLHLSEVDHIAERLVEYLTPLEMQNAENHWIRKAQHERFENEIHQLSNGRQIAANSRLQQFDPFIDEHGLLRIGRRLQNSDLPENMKHPILLPDKQPTTTAIIRRCHLRQLHGGCELTLATLRQRYWILRRRREVKGVIHACPCCKRINSRPFVAKMAPLPVDRIRVTRPFENTGLDLAGPFLTRQGKKVNKNYICLFTCMTTTYAVHLEVVSEMTAPRLLQALRRFVARRQLDKELRQLVSVEMVDNVARELTSHRIQWNFITERAPWLGGYWERLIRSMKTSLKKVLQNSMLDEEELRTVISIIPMIQKCSRLTIFLTGIQYVDIPEVDKDEDEWLPKTLSTSQLIKNWNLRQRLIAQWWTRWKSEYVTSLNIRQK
ncbi:hypothetical protein T11_4328, partial [Trichinella zimbabwensis]